MTRAITVTVTGFALLVGGVGWVYPPAAVIITGAAVLWVGLKYDFEDEAPK